MIALKLNFNSLFVLKLQELCFIISYAGRHMTVDVKTGNGTILTSLAVGDGRQGFAGYSEGSAVVMLETGESVTAVIRDVAGNVKLTGKNAWNGLNKFQGFLLKAL